MWRMKILFFLDRILMKGPIKHNIQNEVCMFYMFPFRGGETCKTCRTPPWRTEVWHPSKATAKKLALFHKLRSAKYCYLDLILLGLCMSVLSKGSGCVCILFHETLTVDGMTNNDFSVRYKVARMCRCAWGLVKAKIPGSNFWCLSISGCGCASHPTWTPVPPPRCSVGPAHCTPLNTTHVKSEFKSVIPWKILKYL